MTNNSAGPISKPFVVGVANQLVEVEIGGFLAPFIGKPGATYLSVIAFTTPTTASDHIVGLRFGYQPAKPSGVATLAANTFTGTQTAPAFVGNGSGLTGLPFPAGAATLGANTFGGDADAPPGVFRQRRSADRRRQAGGEHVHGGQTIGSGNLDLDVSTATTGILTKGGVPFLHESFFGNLFLGTNAGNFSMTGFFNAAIGDDALRSNTSGGQIVAFGPSALFNNTTGEINTAIGFDALLQNSAGHTNTAVGAFALMRNEMGLRNLAVGSYAGVDALSGSDNIYLGANVFGAPAESNTIYLGRQGTQTRTMIAGIRGITTGVANAIPVVIDSNGQLGTVSSSIRFKEDVHDMADVSRRLMRLRPVTFRYTQAYRDGAKPINTA